MWGSSCLPSTRCAPHRNPQRCFPHSGWVQWPFHAENCRPTILLSQSVAALSNLLAPPELIWQCEEQEPGWGQLQMLTVISTEVMKKSCASLGPVSDLVRFFFVIMRIVLIFSRGSESTQVKVALQWMVCGIRTKINTNREKKWAADSLSGFDTPSQLLPAITAVTNIHNYYNKEFSSMCKIKIINIYFATGPP